MGLWELFNTLGIYVYIFVVIVVCLIVNKVKNGRS